MSPNVWRELQVVGVEDRGVIRKLQGHSIQKALFVCVLLRGNGVKEFHTGVITVDGLDVTEKLTAMLQRRSFGVVMVEGVSFADFNLVDPTIIYDEFTHACIHMHEVWQSHWKVFAKLGSVYETVSMPTEPSVYVAVVGAELEWTRRLIRASSVCCRVPEPIRATRLVARGRTRTLQN